MEGKTFTFTSYSYLYPAFVNNDFTSLTPEQLAEYNSAMEALQKRGSIRITKPVVAVEPYIGIPDYPQTGKYGTIERFTAHI